ncbi:hypothetical protein LTR37_010805 [Vermiconidia calcicola]|uniref:Uncharacterized protein n=1 Tax=Vermiconidia calcicola TaxID=1690605 RepID=A0ACC3N3Z6_9PEZI|nr:hypothetical protein LTR37_010805 [Vermiconidia calcicola]
MGGEYNDRYRADLKNFAAVVVRYMVRQYERDTTVPLKLLCIGNSNEDDMPIDDDGNRDCMKAICFLVRLEYDLWGWAHAEVEEIDSKQTIFEEPIFDPMCNDHNADDGLGIGGLISYN